MVDAIDTPALRMAWSNAPWDEAVCGFAVLQVSDIEVQGPAAADDLKVFEYERDRRRAGLVNCRLPHDRLAESMLLEEHGFRFIEMVYQPEFDLSKLVLTDQSALLAVSRAGDDDLPTV